MKLQSGLLYRDGRNASAFDLRAPLNNPDDWKAETSGEICDGPILITYRGTRITWEEDAEVQPFRLGPYVLTFDGRLDNRETIAECAGLTATVNTPDPLIITNAFSKCGERIFAQLIGEFALTLWRTDTRELMFVRSSDGTRPIYYVLDHDRLLWASDFAHLVRVSQIDLIINEEYLLEYLVSQPSPQHTPLSNVHVVPSNSLVRFVNDDFRPPCQLWNPNNIQEHPCASDKEYEEACREKLIDAVRVRLRAKPPIFAELSGGLDSSSIVLLADQLVHHEKHNPSARLTTLSCIYEESQTSDEQYFIRSVEDQRGLQGFHLSEKEQSITLGLKNITFTGIPNPLHCFSARYPRFRAWMRQNGARVLLTGLGGDNLFWSDIDPVPLLADCLSQCEFRRAHTECARWSQWMGLPYFQLLSESLPLALRQLSSQAPIKECPVLPSWLGSKYRKAAQVKRWTTKIFWRVKTTPGRGAQFRLLESLFTQLAADHMSEYHELYISHPFTHRPLVEFCLSVPLSQLMRNGESRSLQRRALADVLPAKVLRRKGKGLLDEALARAVQREWEQTLNLPKWQVCERGFLDVVTLREALTASRLGLKSQDLIRVFSLERWLRSLSLIHRGNSQEGPTSLTA
jgi:asparagine synthase (glutamine-hydrolysing)